MRARCALRAFVAIAVALVSAHSSAQVNTEPLRKKVSETGVSATLGGSLTGRTGNTEGIQAGGTAGVGFGRAPHLVFVYASGDYSRFNDVTQVSKSFAHARYNYELTKWLWAEVFAQAQSDEFQRLKLRNLFGAGPRIAVLSSDVVGVFAGTAYMLERDVISFKPGAADVRDLVVHRLSTYVTANVVLDTRVDLTTTAYVQPRFDDFSDVRFLSDTALVLKVTKALSASINASIRYDSNPPFGVKTTDGEIKNVLSVSL
jgi:hypothetical protein